MRVGPVIQLQLIFVEHDELVEKVIKLEKENAVLRRKLQNQLETAGKSRFENCDVSFFERIISETQEDTNRSLVFPQSVYPELAKYAISIFEKH